MNVSFVCPNPFLLSISTMILFILIFSSTLLSSSANIDHYSSDTIDTGIGFKNPFSVSESTHDENVENVNEFSSQRRKRTTEHSLCDRECDCKRKNHFLAVECNLTKNQQYIFGSKNYIPKEANSLVIKLAPKASLRIEMNFFKLTKVNRISIIGETGTHKNKIHVEFRTNSSANSLAPNPEIEIINCHTLILRENSISGDIKLSIKNCNEVIIFENALYATKFVAVIEEVEDLQIAEHAFYKALGNLRVSRSYIENLYRFDAFFNQIGFYNCTIGNVTGKTFDVIQISAIIFDNCRIKVINSEAMSEKLLSNHLKITGGYIGTIESQAIYGVGVRELVLSNNHIEVIQSNAIKVTAANASITNNRILRVGLEWLRINDWNNVIVSNNTFGEFNLMLLGTQNNNSMKCIFEKNLITYALPGSLNLTNKNCIIREVAFDHLCKCLNYDNWLEELTSRDIRSESFCRVDDQLQFCFNRTQLNVLKYENEVCSDATETLDCINQNNLKRIDGKFIPREELESGSNSNGIWVICLCVSVVILLLFIFLICWCTRKKSSLAQNFTGNQTIDARSRFSKEEKGIINRTLEMVRQNYFHIYEQLDMQVKELLRPDTDERQCVERIRLILEIINRCEDPGDRFVPFNAILHKLLEPVEQNHENHVYAEPQLPSRNIPKNVPGGHTEIEHIYCEPHSVQLPLLTNEYMTPADKNDVATAVYAEPISNNKDKNIISPYPAVTSNNNNKTFIPPQTSTSNKKQMTNVQRMAEQFANISKSPNTDFRIPQYAMSTKKKSPPGPSQTRPEASPTSHETRSNHSGGSDVTVKIDDIDYADA